MAARRRSIFTASPERQAIELSAARRDSRVVRRVSVVALLLLTLGSLAGSGAYAWYLRSPYYRAHCAARLSECLMLPADIGGVVPHSWMARGFTDVVVWLPDRRDRAFVCGRALLRYEPTAADPDAYELELSDGYSEISTRTWLRSDYRFVVESGLRSGFIPGGPQRVRFSGMNIAFVREPFRAELIDAAGQISFESAEQGRATAICGSFNGHPCAEPVLLRVTFSPRAQGVRIDELSLKAPRMPLGAARLRDLAGVDVQRGEFAGELLYQELDEGNRLTVAGRCFDLDLVECTSGRLAAPVRGRCPEVEIQELTMLGGVPQRLRFHGELRDVELGDILMNVGVEGATGRLTLSVGDAIISPCGIERLVASGQALDVSLESLSQAFARGTMTGLLHVTIDDLVIEENRILSLEATVRVNDAEQKPNWVDRELLRQVLAETLHIDLAAILPERVEYTRLGFKAVVDDEMLELFGLHGANGTNILTIRVFGRDLPVFNQPAAPIDLGPWLDQLRADAEERLLQHFPSAGTQPHPR